MTMTRSTKSKKQKRDKAAEKRADIMRQIELGDKIVAYSNAARPHTEFKVGDRIVLFVLTDAVSEAENFFSVGLEYF